MATDGTDSSGTDQRRLVEGVSRRVLIHRAGWWIQVIYLSLFAAAAIVLIPIVGGITEKDRIGKVARRFELARHDLDWDEIWRLGSPELRVWLDPETLDFDSVKGWALPNSFAATSLSHLDDRELFLGWAAYHQRQEHHSDPALLLDDPLSFFGSMLDTPEPEGAAVLVEIDHESAYVVHQTTVHTGLAMVLRDGQWRISRVDCGHHVRLSWGKLPFYLPRIGLQEDEIDFVIEAGKEVSAAGLDDVLRPRLARICRKPGETVVLLHPHPDLDWQTVIDLISATGRAGASRILLARTEAGSPPPGLRVNDVLIGDITGTTDLPRAESIPATGQVLSIEPAGWPANDPDAPRRSPDLR